MLRTLSCKYDLLLPRTYLYTYTTSNLKPDRSSIPKPSGTIGIQDHKAILDSPTIRAYIFVFQEHDNNGCVRVSGYCLRMTAPSWRRACADGTRRVAIALNIRLFFFPRGASKVGYGRLLIVSSEAYFSWQ